MQIIIVYLKSSHVILNRFFDTNLLGLVLTRNPNWMKFHQNREWQPKKRETQSINYLWKEMSMSALSSLTSVNVSLECLAHNSRAFENTSRASYVSTFGIFVVRILKPKEVFYERIRCAGLDDSWGRKFLERLATFTISTTVKVRFVLCRNYTPVRLV